MNLLLWSGHGRKLFITLHFVGSSWWVSLTNTDHCGLHLRMTLEKLESVGWHTISWMRSSTTIFGLWLALWFLHHFFSCCSAACLMQFPCSLIWFFSHFSMSSILNCHGNIVLRSGGHNIVTGISQNRMKRRFMNIFEKHQDSLKGCCEIEELKDSGKRENFYVDVLRGLA